MVVLRAARKLKASLPHWRVDCPESDTALGDWYVNRLVVDRRPLLLLVSAKALLPIVTPARQVRQLPERLAVLVGDRLRRLGVNERVVSSEVAKMSETCVGPTADRSVMGTMVDFAKMISFYLPMNGWNRAALPVVDARLAESPCRVSGGYDDTIFPIETTRALLTARWSSGATDAPPRGPREHLHHEFVLRGDDPDAVDAPGFSAMVVLCAVDDLRYPMADTGAVEDRLRELHRQLDDLGPSEEVWYLRAVVNGCEEVEHDRANTHGLIDALTSYAVWLQSCGHGAEAADVTRTAAAWNAA